MIERFGNLSFDSLDTSGAYYNAVRLWNVFVPQSVRECYEYVPQLLEIPKEYQRRLAERGEIDSAQMAEAEKAQDERRRAYFSQPLRPVLEMWADTALLRAIILGDPGSGKSSLLRYLALQWALIENANQRYAQPLPLLIELRDYNRWECSSGKSFVRYLHEASTWHRLNQQTLHYILQQPDRVILLLDGLDEVFDPVQREQVVNDIHRFSNDYKAARVVVTSRVVGYQPQRLRDVGFRDFMLQDLDADQISHFLDSWHTVTFTDIGEAQLKRDRLGKAIRDSKSIAMLAGNPLLLTMMAILNRHQELPRDRAELYGQASRVLLHQWDTERALEEYPELRGEVDLRAKTAILRKVAYAMQNGPRGLAGNIISGEDLANLIEAYLRDELHFEQARAAARAVVRQLRERNFILCFLGADSYAFVHRTFLEYFCASDFVHRFHIEKSLDIDGLINEFIKHCHEDDWREVLRLICGQINEQFVSKITKHISSRITLDNWNGQDAIPELSLAVYCLAEVRNINRFEEVTHPLFEITVSIASHAIYSSNLRNFLMNHLLPAYREIGTNWPNRSTLQSRAIKEISQLVPYSCGEEFWPHLLAALDSDRAFLQEIAISWKSLALDNVGVRYAALIALADKWPDEITRGLLTERAVQDKSRVFRSLALDELTYGWPDETTRGFLTERAVQDEDGLPRSAALGALADKWPDEITRSLLTERAVQDEDSRPRSAALRALADKWPDEITRGLLTERAVQDKDSDSRSAALGALADRWPDEITRSLLTEQASSDGFAASWKGRKHSKLGHIMFTRDLDGVAPYLNPCIGIPDEHIKQAAASLGIPKDRIDALVDSLSRYLGWNISRGSKAK